MTRYCVQIHPLSPFASAMTGGMLFGHVAWSVREAFGEERLTALLEGYCSGRPFAVLSDAFPHGFVPVPAVPAHVWRRAESVKDRKRLKSLKWLPVEALCKSPIAWQKEARDNIGVSATQEGPFVREVWRTHNSISRLTGTTGEGPFAPYDVSANVFARGQTLDLYVDLDEERLSADELKGLLEAVGGFGFGRDASTGAGKFDVAAMAKLPENAPSRGWLALSASAPSGCGFDGDLSFYRSITYFGRHGNVRANEGTPFKKPIVLADTGAFFWCAEPRAMQWTGKGIFGHSAYADAVHQGYAPLLPVPELQPEDFE